MYDTFILGQVSSDINIDYDGNTIYETGGAVIYSGYAASSLGYKTAVLPKGNKSEQELKELFSQAKNVDVYPVFSETGTSIINQYHTADKEYRTSRAVSRIEPYKISEIPDIKAHIYHIAGLMKGDLGDEIIEYAHTKSKVALDVQGVLRNATDNDMVYKDWDNKLKYLPMIDFLKTDAKESEVLTNCTDREKAAKMLANLGAKEIMITHNTEVLIYRDGKIYTQPLKPRNLSGRSGRGDTCFSTYIVNRITKSIEESLLIAAATVSLKMETPGPFKGSIRDVIEYIKEFY